MNMAAGTMAKAAIRFWFGGCDMYGGRNNMTKSLKALVADWKETRSITFAFLNELSEADLDKKLHRKN